MSATRAIDLGFGKSHALAAVAALACLVAAAPAAAADFVMKFGTATINETQHQFIKFYKEEVEKASGGRIEVQIYPASQLGPIPREIEGVQLGNIQGYIGPVDFFVGVDPRFGVFSAPMLFRDDANAAATIHDPAVEKAMFDLATPKRMVGIATLDLGASDYGAKNAIMRLADFSGKKLRINGTELERAEDGQARRHRHRHAAVRSRAGARPGHDRRHHQRPLGVRLVQDERSPQGDHRHQRHLHHFDRRRQQAVARHAAADLQKIVIDTGAAVQAKSQAMGGRFHQETGRATGPASAAPCTRLPADDLAKMKTLLDPVGRRGDQGSAGRARHAANGPRRRREELTDPCSKSCCAARLR